MVHIENTVFFGHLKLLFNVQDYDFLYSKFSKFGIFVVETSDHLLQSDARSLSA